MKRTICVAAILVSVVLPVAAQDSAVAQPQSAAQEYDVVITGGRVVDGSGNPWYVADVGIRGGRIAAIGRLCGTGTPA